MAKNKFDVDDLLLLLGHFLPDVSVDDLVNDIATKRDGTMFYAGEVTVGAAETQEVEEVEETEEKEEEETEEVEETTPDPDPDPQPKQNLAKLPEKRPASEKLGDTGKVKPAYSLNTFGDNQTSL